MSEFKCKECGSTKQPDKKSINEYADADGNRGQWITIERCSECGYADGFD